MTNQLLLKSKPMNTRCISITPIMVQNLNIARQNGQTMIFVRHQREPI